MPRARSFFPSTLLVFALLIPLLTSCGSKGKVGPTNPGGSSSADTLVTQANVQLEELLYAQISSSSPLTRPSDVNLGTAEQLYRQALAQDPGNAQANFGVAILGLLSLSYDPEVNAAFDEWSTYLQSHVPFQTGNAPGQPLGVPAGLTGGLRGLRLPYHVVPLSLVANMRASQTAADPQISRVQAILSERAVPKLADAINHLTTAASHSDFLFTITPMMQGNASAPPILVHQNDLIVLRAGSELLLAACDVATAYQLGFASYDSVGLVSAFRPGSGWLTLAGSGGNNGRARMADARLKMLASITDSRAAINVLLTQTGDHDNDLIKIPPGSRGRAEAESLNVNLATAASALTSGYTWRGNWDGDQATPDVALTVRVDQMFLNPVSDWKALLPTYTASAIRRPLQMQYYYETGNSSQTARIPVAGYYSGSYYMYGYPGGTPGQYFYGSDSLLVPLRAAAQAQLQRLQAMPGFAGDYSISTDYYGSLSVGTQQISVAWWDNYGMPTSEVFVPQLTWAANSAGAWVWPDPTMGGLFPGIGSSSSLLQTFGYHSGSWTKTVVLDWTELGYRYWW